MGLTAPYGQKNYMGEFDDDTACEDAIDDRGWILSEGMTYMDTTNHRMKFYNGTAWVLFAVV